MMQGEPAGAAVQCTDEFRQVQLLRLHETLFSQTMIRVRINPMILSTKRNRREVRVFLPQSPGSQGIRVGSFNKRRPVSHFSCRLRIPTSVSKPGTPGICPDLAEVGAACCAPALSVSEASLAATAHSGVMAHVS